MLSSIELLGGPLLCNGELSTFKYTNLRISELTFVHAASNMNLASFCFQRPKIKMTSSSRQEVPIFDNRSGLQSVPLSLLLPFLLFLHLNPGIYGH